MPLFKILWSIAPLVGTAEQVHVDSWGRDLGIGERKGKIVKLKYLVEYLSWMTCGGRTSVCRANQIQEAICPQIPIPPPPKTLELMPASFTTTSFYPYVS